MTSLLPLFESLFTFLPGKISADLNESEQFCSGCCLAEEPRIDQLIKNPKRPHHFNSSPGGRLPEGSVSGEESGVQFFGELEHRAVIEFGSPIDLLHESFNGHQFGELQLVDDDVARPKMGNEFTVLFLIDLFPDKGSGVSFDPQLKPQVKQSRHIEINQDVGIFDGNLDPVVHPLSSQLQGLIKLAVSHTQ